MFVSKNESQIELKAKPLSHWQYATLIDIRSGRARQPAREAKTTTLRLLNAQTLSSLFYRGYVECDSAEEPWITPIGENVVEHMNGEGRYRNEPGEITTLVRAYFAKRPRSAPKSVLHSRHAA
jgi:hypothetical protein